MNKIQPFKTSESYTCNSKEIKYSVVDKWLVIQTFLLNSFELFIGCVLFNIGLINTKQSGFCEAWCAVSDYVSCFNNLEIHRLVPSLPGYRWSYVLFLINSRHQII